MSNYVINNTQLVCVAQFVANAAVFLLFFLNGLRLPRGDVRAGMGNHRLLWPLTGLADAIVDLVSSGNTLKANHLVEVEEIMKISARLVVNQAALKLKREPIRAIIDAFASAIPS